ncbi:hypothetical protein ACH5RR_028217 [Cinchona calisaya]|uniref:Cytochrome P450 n=1 Tax=Cinchona calisaya TaxID=153742 RepID=A0ABD2YPH6_9GENT
MAVEIDSIFFMTLALLILLTWLWKILNSIWFRPKKLERYLRGQGLKGSSYRLWHGDSKDIKTMSIQAQSKTINLQDDMLPYVVPFHNHIVQKYGKKSFFWNGRSATMNIMDPDVIRDVLFNYKTFRKTVGRVSPLTQLFISGLVFDEGEHWAKHRKILSPAFYMEKLKYMLPAMWLSCSEVVGKWEKLTEKGSCEFDVLPYVESLTADVISRTAFGSNYEEGKQMFQLLKEQSKLTFQMIQSIYIPGSRFLPNKTNKRVKKLNGEIRAILRDLISKREKQTKAGEMKMNDLLGMLIESNLQEIEEQGNRKNYGMSMDDVIDNCKVFYIAGQETTSSLLVWTIVMLGMHQNWQERARDEVLQIFGHNKPDSEGLNQLKIVSMILNEVLRLYPPAITLHRTTQEVIKLGDITLPVGVDLVVHILLAHHDTELWGDDAKEFNPDRFSEGVAKAAKKPNSFFPFSLGPRVCIGQNYALIEAKLAIASFLQHFSFELSPSYTHAPVRGLTLQPRFGAKMIMHKV